MSATPSRLDLLRDMFQRTPGDPFLAYGIALELARKPEGEEEAAATLLSLLAEHPDYLPAYLQLGLLLARTGNEPEARQVYASGIEVARARGDRHTQGELEGALGAL